MRGGCLALCLSLICEVDIVLVCALPLVRGSNCWREELCTPKIVFAQILSGGSLCGKSCVDDLVEILLCEGRDLKLCARTSKHIFVFAFDPFTNSLSLSLSYIVHCIILPYHIYACVICVCLTYV